MDTNIKNTFYLFNQSHQPEEGWLQSCFKCGVFTSKHISYSTLASASPTRSTYSYQVYLCDYCNYFISNDIRLFIKFNKKCNKFINDINQ